MSQFANSLKTRIQDLAASVETQKTELAAYERVLQIELARESATPTGPIERPSLTHSTVPESAPVPSAVDPANLTFTGNKTTLVGDIVKSYGSAGASPKEVEEIFSARKIKRSKNLVYNTLSYLVSKKKLKRRDGRYFSVLTTPVPQSGSTAPTKRRISPEGLKRIREGAKKRWAAKRAADRAAAK